MITLLLASSFAVRFSGGSPNAFAAALAEGTRQNVVVCQGETESISKLSFENADLTQMARAIRSQTEHAILPGSDMVLSNQRLANSLVTGGGFESAPGAKKAVNFEHIQRPSKKYKPIPTDFIGLPPSALADGLVTFKTKDSEALQLLTLKGSFSKPVTYHWIYRDEPIFLQVRDMPELQLLQWIGKATGARLNPASKTYDFALDPSAIRQRALATLSKLSKESGDSDDQQSYGFRIACLNALTPAQVAEALETPYSTTRVSIRSSTALTNLVAGRIRELEKIQKTYGPNSRASKAAVGLWNRIDPSRPAYLIMDAKFYARLEIPVVDETGRSSGTVNL